MTDRDLLLLSAKAAGYRLEGADEVACIYLVCEEKDDIFLREWNPLTDDGDALRLAVKLDLIVEPPRDNGFCHVYHYGRSLEVRERRAAMTDAAEQAATRRAIVRAAAEIGRSMP